MSNSLLLRSLIMYGACILVAIFVGFQVPGWNDEVGFRVLMAIIAMMLIPFLLKWHHVWLITAWNTWAVVFFLPGRPTLALALTACSLPISVIEHAINQKPPFIHVRLLLWPIVFLTAVVVATMKLTGGLGLDIAGSTNVGGKRYILYFGAILGYFALTAQQIPREKVVRYTTLFLLSPVTSVISDISLFFGPSAVYYIFLVFPPTGSLAPDFSGDSANEIARFSGTAFACSAVVYTMMARYGLRGIFDGGRLWRAPVFLLLFVVSLYGGYRSTVITFALTCGLLFWLEGLYRSRLMPVLCCGALLMFVVLIPLAEHLPLSIQRTLTVVPFIKVSGDAERSAKASSEWRLQMWHEVLPEIAPHLLLGKGYSINAAELEKMKTKSLGNDGAEGAKMAGDYHNGPLSVIIPFGIAGVIGFLWLMGAGVKLLYHNFKYGDPAFQTINTYFLAAFTVKIIFFLAVFGAFNGDMTGFLGILGLSVAINGGVRQPERPAQKRASDAWRVTQARPMALN
jgi:O-Antigen ligase